MPALSVPVDSLLHALMQCRITFDQNTEPEMIEKLASVLKRKHEKIVTQMHVGKNLIVCFLQVPHSLKESFIRSVTISQLAEEIGGLKQQPIAMPIFVSGVSVDSLIALQ